MPLPEPKPNEKRVDFIERCIADKKMYQEYPERDQRVAICYNQWRNKNGKT